LLWKDAHYVRPQKDLEEKAEMQAEEMIPSYATAAALRPVMSAGAAPHYAALVSERLQHLLPQDLHELSLDELRVRLRSLFPLIQWSPYDAPPFDLTFDLVCRHRPGAFKFFLEMLSRWLLSGKQAKIQLCSALDFRLPQLDGEVYTWAQIVLRIETGADFSLLRRNLPVTESEIRLGVRSAYHARRILEVKGLAGDEKIAMVQENIAYLVQRRPRHFGEDIFKDLQHFVVSCGDLFKVIHTSRQMSRIVCACYFLKKLVRAGVRSKPRVRHLEVKFFRTRMHEEGLSRRVLGICVAMNFLRQSELFAERHLLRGLTHYIPGIRVCEGTVLTFPPGQDNVLVLYLETEKPDGAPFTNEEIKRLRRGLPSDLTGRIEQPMHSLSSPLNDEDIMRQTLSLGNQLQNPRDLPHVIINFHEQSEQDVVFNVVLLRLLRGHEPRLLSVLRSRCPDVRFFGDLVRSLGHVRGQYYKEANVFRVALRKEPFFRGNHSLDLYMARRRVRDIIRQAVGEFRDYNGGMIDKQEGVLDELRKSLGTLAVRWDWLLEDFFHSIRPVVMRSVLHHEPLRRLFIMLSNAIDEREHDRVAIHVKLQEDGNYAYALLLGPEPTFRDRVLCALENLELPHMRLAVTTARVAESLALAILYQSEEAAERFRIINFIEATVTRPKGAPTDSPALLALY
jgi:hypothetical protein